MRTLLLCLALGLGTALGATEADAAAPRAARLDSVDGLRHAGNTAAAARLLQNWIKAHPGDVEARVRLGEVRLDAGDADGAARAWRDAVALSPGDVSRTRMLGVRLEELGRDADALAIYEAGRAALGGPIDPFAWQRAELCLGLGRWAEAVEAHRIVLRQEPHRQAMVQGRLTLLARRQGPGALGAYADALTNAVKETEGRERARLTSLLAACALEMGQPRRGLDALRAALQAGADDDVVTALFAFASRCEAQGNDELAAEAYALFARQARDSPFRAHSQLKQAQMYESLGQVSRALELYRALAAGRGPEAVAARLHAARLQAETQGDPAGALETLRDLDGQTGSPDLTRQLWLQRADCHLRLDDLAAAAADYRRLAAAPEARAEADFGLAQLAFYQARFDSAAALADSLARRDPGAAVTNDALGLLLLVDAYGDQPQALALLARARLRRRQGRVAAADSAWQLLAASAPPGLRHTALLEQAAALEAAAPARALALYDTVAADEPEARQAVSAALGRARVLESSGRPKEALRAYETALLAAPGDARSPDMRRQIERLRTLLGDSG